MKVLGIKVNKLAAELIGTFALVLAVLASVNGFVGGIPTAVVAGFVVLIAVLMIGVVSGAHLNPAVTAALFSIGKIDAKSAAAYVVMQMIAGVAALSLMSALLSDGMVVLGAGEPWDTTVVLAEVLGVAFFTFGIAAAIRNKLAGMEQAMLIGGSLTLGIVFALAAGSLGVLNPAVALGLGVFNWSYVIAPVIGAIIGMNVHEFLIADKK